MVEKRNQRKTKGWNSLSKWYDGWVGDAGSRYHQEIGIPRILSATNVVAGKRILDVGCGQGVLAPYVIAEGGVYVGIDVSHRLIEIARTRHPDMGQFVVADAARLELTEAIERMKFDVAIFLLSIQDMNPLDEVLESVSKTITSNGTIVIFMTHPAFRVPRQSGWLFDETRGLVSRRVDSYLSNLNVPLKDYSRVGSGKSISFHRPLQDYFQSLTRLGFMIDLLEEIPDSTLYKKQISKQERRASREIPLFLLLRAVKVGLP
ncbi:MAG: class I SAM-dependent methyltransferase [Chloroflexi bacterium]|nr:class I SAM-dependent methyltransferase [Chloroflexota bacterium]